MDSSAPYISANVGRFRGFADHYDAFRPQPPVMLVTILTQLAEVPYPTLVAAFGRAALAFQRYYGTPSCRCVLFLHFAAAGKSNTKLLNHPTG